MAEWAEEAVGPEPPSPSEQSPEDAFEAVYAAEAAALRAWLRARTGNAEDGDELVAETFLRALRGWDGFRGEARRRSWLWRIARNTLANWRRRRREHPVDATPEVGAERDAGETVAEQEAVWELLTLIPDPRARTATYLRYVEGRGAEEVAATMGTTPGAVRTLTWRALQELRRQLEER